MLIYEGVEEALTRLAIGYFTYVIFWTARDLASKSKCHIAKAYLWAIVPALILSRVSWMNYGTVTEPVDDPLFGYVEREQAFEPTDEERNRRGVSSFTFIAIPCLIGTHKGLAIRKESRAKE